MSKRKTNGQFRPGKSGNPNGRPKGSNNKTTMRTKQFIACFLEEEQGKASEDWQKLSPWERWQIRTRLYEYVAPKLARSETSLDISKLTDEDVNDLLNRALEKLETND